MAKHKIPTGLPQEVLVDPDIAEWASAYSWFIDDKGYGHRYVVRSVWINGITRHLLLHREIMHAKPRELVDHINGNDLDNRRCNLRTVGKSGNGQNRTKPCATNTSGFRGVYRQQGKWRSYCTASGKRYYGGTFDSVELAAQDARLLRKLHMPFSEELVV